MIRSAAESDAAAIASIYNHYILHTVVTFEEEAVKAEEMAKRFAEITGLELPYLVACEGDAVIGYAYASRWKGRCAYRFAVETTIYLDANVVGKGMGTRLYQALLDAVAKKEMHTAIGGIALPNDASVRLHEKLGFKKVSHFAEVGFKQNRWVDVGYWQRFFTA